jgi:hypothetical protein
VQLERRELLGDDRGDAVAPLRREHRPGHEDAIADDGYRDPELVHAVVLRDRGPDALRQVRIGRWRRAHTVTCSGSTKATSCSGG